MKKLEVAYNDAFRILVRRQLRQGRNETIVALATVSGVMEQLPLILIYI